MAVLGMPSFGCSDAPSLGASAAAEVEPMAALAIPGRGLRHFGYYAGDSDRFGHYMEEVADYATYTFIAGPYYDWEALVPHAERAQSLGLEVVVDVSLCFFDYVKPGAYIVKKGWRGYFRNVCAPSLERVLERSKLFAFYVMDEPYGNGLTQADVEVAVAELKSRFPGARTWITENPWTYGAPKGIDLYSIDCHAGWMCGTMDPACLASTWNWCKGRVHELIDQTPESVDLMLTVEAFGSGTFDPTPEQQALWEDEFSRIPRFSGIAWFMYPDAPDIGFRGTRSNAPVKKHHREFALAHR